MGAARLSWECTQVSQAFRERFWVEADAVRDPDAREFAALDEPVDGGA